MLLGTPKRKHVALLVETSLGSGRDILRGIARYVREHEPWSIYHEPRGLSEPVPSWLRKWQGDGIIARIQTKQMAEFLASLKIPIVDVLGVVRVPTIPLVHVDNVAIAQMAAEHLEERGFMHFGFFGIMGENWSEMRRDAFGDCAKNFGFDFHFYELPRSAPSKSSWEEIEDSLAEWIKKLPKPAGVMVCSDQRGHQFLEACRRANIAVPDEIAVIGVDDDLPLCEVCNPPLSSVRPGHEIVGYKAAEMLDLMFHNKQIPDTPILIKPSGITVRLSSDVLAIEDRKIASAIRIIRESACEGIRVDDLAKQVGLSRSVLQRKFKAILNRTVHKEIIRAKLKRAQELLTGTNLSLLDIAERTGFKHQEYLGVVFKSFFGVTPAEYRRLNSTVSDTPSDE
jgi:LacI family transcriptional regulator